MHEQAGRRAREARQSQGSHPQRAAVALQRKSLGGLTGSCGTGGATVHARPINIKYWSYGGPPGRSNVRAVRGARHRGHDLPALVVFRWRGQSQLRHTAWAHEKREGQRERGAGVGKTSVKSSRQMLHWSRIGGVAGTGGRAGPHVRSGLQCCAMASARSIHPGVLAGRGREGERAEGCCGLPLAAHCAVVNGSWR